MVRQAAVIALLVLLVGCGGSPGANPVDGTLSPAPVPATATPAPHQQVLAPGLTGTGVTDPGRLAGAHRNALDGRSFTLIENRTVEGPNATVAASSRRLRVTEGWSRYDYVRVAESATDYPISAYRQRLEAWYDGHRVYFRGVRNGEIMFSYQRGNTLGDMTRVDRLLVLYTTFKTRVLETDEGYRVMGTNPADPATLDVPPPLTNSRNATFVADVGAEGLVSHYQLTYEATFKGRQVRVTRSVHFEAVGETAVEAPDWYERARNATG